MIQTYKKTEYGRNINAQKAPKILVANKSTRLCVESFEAPHTKPSIFNQMVSPFKELKYTKADLEKQYQKLPN